MTQSQVKAAIEQSNNIISMMDSDTLNLFKSLSQDNQFQFICASLAATA